MQKNTFAFILLFFTNSFLFTQEDNIIRPLLGLKWTPTSLVNPNTATWMIGAELWLSDKYYAQFDYGLQARKTERRPDREDTENWKYQKIKIGLRASLSGGSEHGLFIGGDFFLIPQSYTDRNGTSPYDHRVYLNYRTAEIEKDAWGAMGSMIYRTVISDNILVEMYFGLGMKRMNVVHRVDLETATLGSGFPPNNSLFNLYGRDQDPGKKEMPYADMGIKIGYLFYRK